MIMRVEIEENTGEGYPEKHLLATFKEGNDGRVSHMLRANFDRVTEVDLGNGGWEYHYELSNGCGIDLGDKLFIEFSCSKSGARKLWEKMTSKGFKVVE